ncbi:MAG TPA: tetratricopeptide repeat protein [Longimicrobium sp.]|nr:tetratricopeptide repeat protein [Longimicrobium sp.]
MSFDPDSTLRPLRQRAPDVDALRGGQPSAALVVRIATAAETTLRRMLRDDPTAALELRLRALSPDDLPTPDLLAELRRRERLPVALAAAFHDLDLAAERIAGGAEPSPRDAQLAVSVADGLDAHVRSLPAHVPMEDPALPERDAVIPMAADEDEVHAVPSDSPRRRVPWAALGALAVLALLLVMAIRMRGGGGDDELRRGEAALRANRTAQAERHFRAAATRDADAPLPRVYLARIYREAGRREDAVRELRTGLVNHPDDPALNTELGYVLLEARRPQEAVARFRTAIERDDRSLHAWGGLVRALRESGRTAEADRELARAPADLRALMASTPRTATPSPAPRR